MYVISDNVDKTEKKGVEQRRARTSVVSGRTAIRVLCTYSLGMCNFPGPKQNMLTPPSPLHSIVFYCCCLIIFPL